MGNILYTYIKSNRIEIKKKIDLDILGWLGTVAIR